MSTRSLHVPPILHLDHGFCDPARTSTSKLAVFRQADGTRIELAIRDAIAVHSGPGPRVESHQLIVSRPTSRRDREVAIIQLQDLTALDGVPEVQQALVYFEAGRLKDAARYAAAAGPRWRGLVELLGGPA